MKRLVKLALMPFWRMSAPIRRPLLARLDARLDRLVAGTVNARMLPELIDPLAVALRRLERIEDSLARADRSAALMAEEVDLVLNGISREVFRLQAQVESLQNATHRDRRPGGPLSIVDESHGERSRVG